MKKANKLTKIKVRGYHLDLYGHVNNARYLEFLEEARWNLFEDDILTWGTMGVSFIVVNINISYKAPALLNTILSVHSEITKLRSRSCVICQKVTDSKTGSVIAEADVTFVIVDKSGKAIPIKDEMIGLLKNYSEGE